MKPQTIYTIHKPDEKPETNNKVIALVESHGYGPNNTFKSKNVLLTKHNGKTFDSHAWNVKEWLNKEDKFVFTKEELIDFASTFWNGSAEYYADDSDFPMGDGKKQEPNFDELVDKIIE